ncbi:putative FeS cluster biogenesis [Rosa chinensis]|uniref:Putative FeS cluster biogenesis n=1 Tax=Rosa chinensis TaxID=74649 RepID=A0A2P6QL81_ROSCH|nr:putative FeS cluster biogenesis [Rosa chinensis]
MACSMLIPICVSAASTSDDIAPAISLTENASKHFNKMRSKHNEDLCLGIGVKQGGYSGMSYTMDFYSKENARPDDSTIEYNGFKIGQPSYFHSLSQVSLDYL